MSFLYSTKTSEVTPKEYIVLIKQDGNFCEQLTNMFSCAFVYVNLFPRY